MLLCFEFLLASELKAVLLALSSDIYSAEVSTLLYVLSQSFSVLLCVLLTWSVRCLHAPASCGLDGAELARQLRISHAPELYRSLQDGARRSVLTQCFLKRYASLVPNLQQRKVVCVFSFGWFLPLLNFFLQGILTVLMDFHLSC